MKVLLLVLLGLLAAVSALPPPLNEDTFDVDNESLDKQQNDTYGFRRVWIDQRGRDYNRRYQNTLEVAFTSGVSGTGQQKSLYILKRMMWYMAPSIFNTLCQRAKSGVFTRREKITTFPEYARHRDTPQCRGHCRGSCRVTCTFDGRKYDSLAGVGGVRGVAVEDNILCNRYDPYRQNMNVLVHEFSHTIQGYALSADLKAKITRAYNTARYYKTWTPGSYAMANEVEYFAHAAGVFFHSDKFGKANGGMSRCFGKSYCANEAEGRRWLQYRDSQIFSVLNYVFTNNSGRMSGLTGPCI